jgi:hypothetical protein
MTHPRIQTSRERLVIILVRVPGNATKAKNMPTYLIRDHDLGQPVP